jgi:hypothetical protein
MPNAVIKINPDTQLYSKMQQLQDLIYDINRIKKRLDALIGFPADFTDIAADYGVDTTKANTLFNFVTSLNTALQAAPFTGIANYDQGK